MRKTATSDSLHLHPILVPVFYMGYPKQLVVPNWTTSSVHCAHEDICKDQGTRRYSNLVLTYGVFFVDDSEGDLNSTLNDPLTRTRESSGSLIFYDKVGIL